MLDPVSVVAGVLKTQIPSLDMQQCARIAWDIVHALKGAAAVQEPGKDQAA